MSHPLESIIQAEHAVALAIATSALWLPRGNYTTFWFLLPRRKYLPYTLLYQQSNLAFFIEAEKQ